MKIYGLNTLQAGLTYLAFGIASALTSYGAGKITDYDYRKTVVAHGFTINKASGDKLLEFPIEKARLRTVWLHLRIINISLGVWMGIADARSPICAAHNAVPHWPGRYRHLQRVQHANRRPSSKRTSDG